jgi:hypothetical protein
MNEAAAQIASWASADRSVWAAISAPGLIAFSFLAFNAIRIVLHVPQFLTCLRDKNGCSAINVWTWCSWSAASMSNALYMGLLLGDAWGLALNLGNALMCMATVCITCIKRRRRASAASRASRSMRSAGVVFFSQ